MRGMAQRFDALTRRIEALEAAAARDQQPDPPVHDPQGHSVDASTGRPITRSSGGYAGLRQGWHTGVSEHNPGSPDAMLQRVADRLEASMAVMAHSLDVESEEE